MIAGTSTALAAEPIKIAVIAPVKTTVGKGMFRGAELAVDNIDAAGGVNGRPLKLLKFTSHLSATNAVRAWQKAVNSDHVVAGVGVFVSEVALALEPWVGRLKVPFIDTGSASPRINHQIHKNYDNLKYYFSANLGSPQLAQMVCDSLHDNAARKFDINHAVILAEDMHGPRRSFANTSSACPRWESM